MGFRRFQVLSLIFSAFVAFLAQFVCQICLHLKPILTLVWKVSETVTFAIRSMQKDCETPAREVSSPNAEIAKGDYRDRESVLPKHQKEKPTSRRKNIQRVSKAMNDKAGDAGEEDIREMSAWEKKEDGGDDVNPNSWAKTSWWNNMMGPLLAIVCVVLEVRRRNIAMRTERARLTSFHKAPPHLLPRFHVSVARQGFYYDAELKAVVCFICGVHHAPRNVVHVDDCQNEFRMLNIPFNDAPLGMPRSPPGVRPPIQPPQNPPQPPVPNPAAPPSDVIDASDKGGLGIRIRR